MIAKTRLAFIVALLLVLPVGMSSIAPAAAAPFEAYDCFTPDPPWLDFGRVPVGSSLQLAVTLTNDCERGALPFGTGVVGGSYGLGDESTCYGHRIKAGQTCVESAIFIPSQEGVDRGWLGLWVNPNVRLAKVYMVGVGI
jgi:hypothetical protein